MKKTTILFLAMLCLLAACNDNKDKTTPPKTTVDEQGTEMLLVGTFHFHNPGADVVKTKSFDIMSDKSQKELSELSEKITLYNPSKIFVEWEYDRQEELDSLYQLYLQNDYFKDGMSDFYQKNEIFQLAFRIAKSSGHDKVYAMDYRETEFPFDSVMTVINVNGQKELQQKIQKVIKQITEDFDSKIEAGISLKELIYHLNLDSLRKQSNDFHMRVPLIAGDETNFIGPYLTAEWYRRNLYMWSLIQKNTTPEDEKIMVLVGASHAAIFEELISHDPNWNIIGLKEVVE